MQIKSFIKIKFLIMVLIGGLVINKVIAAPQSVVEGTDYVLLTSPVTATSEPKGRVNVKEFFSFTCIHCKDADPLIETTLVPNKKIDLNKIQVVWDPVTTNYGKLNATIQTLGLSKLYTPAFNAIFNHQDLNDQEQLKTFLLQNGLSKVQVNKFLATYNSFTVNSKVAEYKKMLEMYNVTGTPTFIVADKYVVKPALPARLIEVVQALVDKSANAK